MTSALALFVDLKLPAPWSPQKPSGSEKLPILIYGASSATGAFAGQLAKLSNIHPIIGVAGKSAKLASEFCDYIVDYRDGEDAVVKGIQEALKIEGLDDKVKHVYDGVSEKGSHDIIARVIDPNGGVVSHLLPLELFAPKGFKYAEGVEAKLSHVEQAHGKQKDFAFLGYRYFARAMEDGRFKAHPFEVIPNGLEGVPTGLKNLRDGAARGVKYVYRIAETPGVGK
jgi:NADPH:quinone reductase-like Zn-dependent oxidoreductase